MKIPGLTSRRPGSDFNLIRRFSVLSLISIVIACSASSFLLARFLTEHILYRYAKVSHEFVQSIADIENNNAIAAGRTPSISDRAMSELFRHLSVVPETLRTNIYDAERRIVWSSDDALIGKQFGDNHDLDEALQGKLEIESGITGKEEHPKQEHMFLSDRPVPYVEIYMPIYDSRNARLLGVAEIYRIPSGLFETIDTGTRLIWTFGAGSGIFLFVTLFWIVRRAHRTIRDQQDQLIESETLAIVGEMGSAVAHGIRNPLASIRSSAELWQEDAAGAAREAASDIVAETDKLEKWVRDLLTYSQPEHGEPERVNVREVLARVLERFERELKRRGIASSLDAGGELPAIAGDQVLFEQVFANLVTNAMEAMPDGGKLSISSAVRPRSRQVLVTVADTGIGMHPRDQARAFTPFHTSKPKGMGLGLALVRRIVRRFGGRVSIDSTPGRGTAVTLEFATLN